ncbi:MAG: YlmC/YmxH family sporulation protein [Oscillospiraceae bacterium]|nr:YlmC/YmxH family sporulation protein [Oscillospiraceae bacterium]
MTCCFEDLRNKEIIHVKTGSKIGFVDDVVFETRTAKICDLIVFGQSRFFGLFGRDDDFVIPWNDVEVIGGDTILVSCDFPQLSANSAPKRRRFMGSLLK